MNSKIKTWYMKHFPTDDLGQYINPKATFKGLSRILIDGENVYSYIGFGDSLVRERIFGELADLMGVDYNVIYRLWVRVKKPA